MYDISSFETKFGRRNFADFHIKRMVLFPYNWAMCRLPIKLNWQVVRFAEQYASRVPNTCGVYSFLVQPGIANHRHCSYLLYVGETKDQNFRVRYRQYLRDKALGDKSRRPHVAEMLRKWDGYLWFCYARIKNTDAIEAIEEALLKAYLPPTNKDFPGGN
jgi:hypothetical protein